MPRLHNFNEVNEALRPYVQLVHSNLGKDTALERIAPLMAAAGNPHEKLKIIHLAGTSGKTSTAYYTAALLRTTGKNVGLTVSPHVDSVAERVQLNGEPLTEAEFCSRLSEFLDIVETLEIRPTYFELLYSFSFWVFAAEDVDYAVVETGMGGLYDPTNIAAREDKVCIITDIGFDHMHVLGHTLPEIAAQKAGIIHKHNAVFMYHQSEEVNGVVEDRAVRMDADVHVLPVDASAGLYTGGFNERMADFQRHNWLLAYAAFRYIAERDHLPDVSYGDIQATQTVSVPGRMDIRTVGNRTIVMDGAHNAQKMETFLASFRRLYPDTKPAVLLAIKEGKEPVEIIADIAALAGRIIITTFETSQDLPAISINPQALADMFQKVGALHVTAIPDRHAAYRELLAGPESVCIITGSFYLLSQLRDTEHLI